jgi:lysophospholipase L1-like esterase
MASLLSRYPTVVAFDLRNELRTNVHNRARQISDWMKYFPQGINALNRANPNALIFVSALDYDTDFSFFDEGMNSGEWIDVSERLRHRLVFEGHIYTWSGYGNPTDDCSEMMPVFQRRLGWPLRNNRPLVISEFGLDVDRFPENTKTDMQWFNCVKRFVLEQKLGYAHWILDGSYYTRDDQLNNKESYGLLEADWSAMKKNGIFTESLKTMDWIRGESHRDCYRQSDMMFIGRLEIWWGREVNNAVWACNNWVPECDGACVVKTPWNCYRQADLMWVGRVEIWWGHEEDHAAWACNNWVPECDGSCNVKSHWECHRQTDLMLVGRVAIWWGHEANDAVWACNNWVPECEGVCNIQADAPMDVFAYGDSLTWGHDEQTYNFSPPRPTPYAKYLNQELTYLLQPAAIVQHLGLSGWTSDQMLDKINDETNGLCPIVRRNPTLSLVMILVGTNDLGGIESANVPEDRARSIVQSIVDLHTRTLSCARDVNNVALHTLSIGIPGSRYQNENPIAGQMARYINNALKEFASSDPRISYVDFPTPFQENDNKWHPDGLHMSGEGYKFLGEALAEPVMEILASSRTGASLETWSGVSGNSITDLMRGTNNLANAPSKSERLGHLLEAPTNANDNYGLRMKGWLVPPVTGLYEFWIASDDQGEFWLSSNGNPANKVRRCSQPNFVSPRLWNKYPEQKSSPISLVAGQAYYYEVRLHVLISLSCAYARQI